MQDLAGEKSVLALGITRRFDRLLFVEGQIAAIDKAIEKVSRQEEPRDRGQEA